MLREEAAISAGTDRRVGTTERADPLFVFGSPRTTTVTADTPPQKTDLHSQQSIFLQETAGTLEHRSFPGSFL